MCRCTVSSAQMASKVAYSRPSVTSSNCRCRKRWHSRQSQMPRWLREALIYSRRQDGAGFRASPGGVSAAWLFQVSERQRRIAGKPARSIRIAPANRPDCVSRRIHAPPPVGPPSAVSIRSRRMGARRSFGMTKLRSSRLAWPVCRQQLGGANQSVLPWCSHRYGSAMTSAGHRSRSGVGQLVLVASKSKILSASITSSMDSAASSMPMTRTRIADPLWPMTRMM